MTADTHQLLFPPHPDGFYVSSALCSCGDFQWDGDTGEAVLAARSEVIADWQIHVAPAPRAAAPPAEPVEPSAGLAEKLHRVRHAAPFGDPDDADGYPTCGPCISLASALAAPEAGDKAEAPRIPTHDSNGGDRG